MRTKITALTALIIIALAYSSTTSAQTSNFAIKGSHNFGVSAGLINKTSVFVSGADVETRIGLSGGVYYGYGLNDEFEMNFYAGYLQGEVITDNSLHVIEPTFRQTSAFVMPLLAGIKYYPIKLAFNENVRPYASVSAGIVTGFSTRTSLNFYYQNVTEHKSQSVIAFRLGAGIETAPARNFRIGLFAGYILTGEFDEPVGTLTRYNGAEFNVTAGFSL